MIAAELTKKIDALPIDEYKMVEAYVNNVAEYAKRRKKEAAWNQVRSDLERSKERMDSEGGIDSQQLRKNLGV